MTDPNCSVSGTSSLPRRDPGEPLSRHNQQLAHPAGHDSLPQCLAGVASGTILGWHEATGPKPMFFLVAENHNRLSSSTPATSYTKQSQSLTHLT